MHKIYLARHGQNIDNANGILNGHRDLPLTELGREQALALGQKIKDLGLKFDFVHSSPLVRAFDTGCIITGLLGIDDPEILDELIERNFGVMTGKRISDIKALCGPDIIETNLITYFLSPEGAETFPELLERAKRVLRKISETHSSGSKLLVGHGDFGKMLYCAYYGLDWRDCLESFHFGNSELLLLSPDTDPKEAHVFRQQQHNH